MGGRGYFEVGTHSVMMLICEQTQEMVAAASASEVQVWDWAGSKHLVSLHMGGGQYARVAGSPGCAVR